MAGNGKYTTYVPSSAEQKARMGFLEKLYPGNAKQSPLFVAALDQSQAAQMIAEMGNAYLRPRIQDGDKGTFPQGVDMTYAGSTSPISVPDTTEGKDVKWQDPGDPATSHVPDISSPGPGMTEGKDKVNDPGIKDADIRQNVPPSANTYSPSQLGSKVYHANRLGTEAIIGIGNANDLEQYKS